MSEKDEFIKKYIHTADEYPVLSRQNVPRTHMLTLIGRRGSAMSVYMFLTMVVRKATGNLPHTMIS